MLSAQEINKALHKQPLFWHQGYRDEELPLWSRGKRREVKNNNVQGGNAETVV